MAREVLNVPMILEWHCTLVPMAEPRNPYLSSKILKAGIMLNKAIKDERFKNIRERADNSWKLNSAEKNNDSSGIQGKLRFA